MRIAATDSRGGRGPTGTFSALVSLISPRSVARRGGGARFFPVIENVVLIDEADAALGEGEKLAVHRQGTLHRAFSVFAFNPAGELPLHRRAPSQYHPRGPWAHTPPGPPPPRGDGGGAP